MTKPNHNAEVPIHQILTERRARLRCRLAGRSLAILADQSGISRQTLWRIREGHTLPDAETVDAIDAALNDEIPRETGAPAGG